MQEKLKFRVPCVKSKRYRAHYSDTISILGSAFDGPCFFTLGFGNVSLKIRIFRDVSSSVSGEKKTLVRLCGPQQYTKNTTYTKYTKHAKY